jgi:hypothetical protein
MPSYLYMTTKPEGVSSCMEFFYRLRWSETGTFCAVGHFVAENAQWRLGMAVHISEGHITCDGGTWPSYTRYESSLKVSDSAEPQFAVWASLGQNRTSTRWRQLCPLPGAEER